MSFEPDCIFCQILRGQAPADVVYRDDLLAAFMDIHPVTPGHLLVVPSYHTPELACLPEKYAAHLMVIAGRMSAALKNSDLRCEAVSLSMADGEAAGQTVFHTHLHLIPRFRGDGAGFRPHGTGSSRSQMLLSEQAAVIRFALEKLDD